ncbi:MAG: hypothetical protein M1828_005032 [Chrysothrix sp. TS-e1954]|nr:MAG: hypothetical protein M1828_005032 [Chrysothrix sp. TS-e1954]
MSQVGQGSNQPTGLTGHSEALGKSPTASPRTRQSRLRIVQNISTTTTDGAESDQLSPIHEEENENVFSQPQATKAISPEEPSPTASYELRTELVWIIFVVSLLGTLTTVILFTAGSNKSSPAHNPDTAYDFSKPAFISVVSTVGSLMHLALCYLCFARYAKWRGRTWWKRSDIEALGVREPSRTDGQSQGLGHGDGRSHEPNQSEDRFRLLPGDGAASSCSSLSNRPSTNAGGRWRRFTRKFQNAPIRSLFFFLLCLTLDCVGSLLLHFGLYRIIFQDKATWKGMLYLCVFILPTPVVFIWGCLVCLMIVFVASKQPRLERIRDSSFNDVSADSNDQGHFDGAGGSSTAGAYTYPKRPPIRMQPTGKKPREEEINEDLRIIEEDLRAYVMIGIIFCLTLLLIPLVAIPLFMYTFKKDQKAQLLSELQYLQQRSSDSQDETHAETPSRTPPVAHFDGSEISELYTHRAEGHTTSSKSERYLDSYLLHLLQQRDWLLREPSTVRQQETLRKSPPGFDGATLPPAESSLSGGASWSDTARLSSTGRNRLKLTLLQSASWDFIPVASCFVTAGVLSIIIAVYRMSPLLHILDGALLGIAIPILCAYIPLKRWFTDETTEGQQTAANLSLPTRRLDIGRQLDHTRGLQLLAILISVIAISLIVLILTHVLLPLAWIHVGVCFLLAFTLVSVCVFAWKGNKKLLAEDEELRRSVHCNRHLNIPRVNSSPREEPVRLDGHGSLTNVPPHNLQVSPLEDKANIAFRPSSRRIAAIGVAAVFFACGLALAITSLTAFREHRSRKIGATVGAACSFVLSQMILLFLYMTFHKKRKNLAKRNPWYQPRPVTNPQNEVQTTLSSQEPATSAINVVEADQVVHQTRGPVAQYDGAPEGQQPAIETEVPRRGAVTEVQSMNLRQSLCQDGELRAILAVAAGFTIFSTVLAIVLDGKKKLWALAPGVMALGLLLQLMRGVWARAKGRRTQDERNYGHYQWMQGHTGTGNPFGHRSEHPILSQRGREQADNNFRSPQAQAAPIRALCRSSQGHVQQAGASAAGGPPERQELPAQRDGSPAWTPSGLGTLSAGELDKCLQETKYYLLWLLGAIICALGDAALIVMIALGRYVKAMSCLCFVASSLFVFSGYMFVKLTMRRRRVLKEIRRREARRRISPDRGPRDGNDGANDDPPAPARWQNAMFPRPQATDEDAVSALSDIGPPVIAPAPGASIPLRDLPPFQSDENPFLTQKSDASKVAALVRARGRAQANADEIRAPQSRSVPMPAAGHEISRLPSLLRSKRSSNDTTAITPTSSRSIEQLDGRCDSSAQSSKVSTLTSSSMAPLLKEADRLKLVRAEAHALPATTDHTSWKQRRLPSFDSLFHRSKSVRDSLTNLNRRKTLHPYKREGSRRVSSNGVHRSDAVRKSRMNASSDGGRESRDLGEVQDEIRAGRSLRGKLKLERRGDVDAETGMFDVDLD